MRSKSRSNNSPEGNSEGCAKENVASVETIASYNQLISSYMQCPRVRPQCCVSNVGDGTLLVKATIVPLPPFTTLISEEDWLKIVQTMKCTLQESDTMEMSPVDNSTAVVDCGSKTPLSDTGTNNLVDPIKDSPPASPGKWSFSPRRGSSSSHSPMSRYDMDDASSVRRRGPLKVRFHRLGDDEYEVVGSAAGTSAGESSESTSKQLSKKAHKKAKKAKKRRASMDLDQVAYMIDESHLVENRGSKLSEHTTVNGSNDVVVPNGDVHVKDLDCSLSKKEKDQNSMNAMATWLIKSEEAASGDDGGAEASVTHHIWKKKQRRGEPVVKTSYVRRQGTPVTCTINLRSRPVPRFPEFNSEVVPRRSSERLRSRYSVPPPSSRCERPRRVTKSASPSRVRHSRYEPIYPEDEDIIYCPFMNTRSRDPESSGRNGLVIIKKEEDVDETEYRQVVSPSGGNTGHITLKMVKQECEDVEEHAPPNSATPNDINVADSHEQSKPIRVRRTSNRPKKLRPRAGRRTGERVASDEELPPDAASVQKSVRSPDSSHSSVRKDVSVGSGCDGDDSEPPESPVGNRSMPQGRHQAPSEISSVETNKGSPSDGLYIDEEEVVSNRSGSNSGQSQDQAREVFHPKEEADEELISKVKTEPISFEEEDSQAIATRTDYEMTEAERTVIRGRPDEKLMQKYRRFFLDHPIDHTIGYRYRMWSHAYRTFRLNPFLVPPARGQVPQLVRYPMRPLRDVRYVIRNEECFVKHGVKYEVAVKNPPKEPNERNWKEIYNGDVLWVRWRKNEYWPATAYSISDTAPVEVTVLWINDKTQSTVDYTLVDSFDMAFHIRYDARRTDAKYIKAVATALRYMGKMGFWECHITAKVYKEIIKEEGESFCRHILPEELTVITNKEKVPKLAKDMKKDDQIRMQRSVEILQALQASHFIDIYHRSPLVGNALPLTQYIVDDYQGSKEYASGNLDPLFVDGSELCFDEDVKAFNFDPEVMGSNEIVQWDGDIGKTSSGYDTTDASLGSEIPPDDSEAVAPNANVPDGDANEEEFPQPFSEIDALRLTNPEKLPPKKRHGTRSVTPKPAPKRKRQ